MTVKKIWVAQHPTEPDNYQVSFADRDGEGEYMMNADGTDYGWVAYQEYVMLPVGV